MSNVKYLRALPVLPGHSTDLVKNAYVAELKAVTNAQELKAFTTRWTPLYTITKNVPIDKKGKDAKRFRVTHENMLKLIAGKYDADIAWACIQTNRTGECKHIRMYSCPGAHIALPMVFIQVEMMAKHYGVSTDLALVQMNGGWGEYETYTGVTGYEEDEIST